MTDEPSNPFISFFSSPEAVEDQKSAVEQQRCELGNALTRIFLCTPSTSVIEHADRPRFVVVLPQLSKDQMRLGKTGDLDLDTLPQGVAERLQMVDPSCSVIHCKRGKTTGLLAKTYVVEKSNLNYLAYCYTRACNETEKGLKTDATVFIHMVNECKKLIVEMCNMVLSRLDTDLSSFNNLLLTSIQSSGSSTAVANEFFYKIAESHANNFPKLKSLFDPTLLNAHNACRSVSLLSPENVFDSLSVVEIYSRHNDLAKVLVTSSCWCPQLNPNTPGKLFESETIFGRLLSLTTIAPSSDQPSEFFPLDMDIRRSVEENMAYVPQQQLESLINRMHKVFDGLLRKTDTRNAVISWIVRCLEANNDRGKMLSRLQQVMGPQMTCAGDGFFLNLGWIMLKLAAPFTRGDSPTIRLTSIAPQYCLVAANAQIHPHERLLNFVSETRMVPTDPEDAELQSSHPDSDPNFNFTTHCFFLAHKTLMLGMSQIMQRFGDIMRYYQRSFHMMQNIISSSGMSGPLYRRIHSQFLLIHSQVQGFKAHIAHPQLIELCLIFQATTARWLVWLAIPESHDITTQSPDPDTLFPLPKKAPVQMRTVPECLIDNIVHLITYLGLSGSDALTNNTPRLAHFITFATVFMGSPQYVQNPHVRAGIARLLSLMIITDEDSSQGLIPLRVESQRELFENHKVASAHLIRVVMKIFVDIEYTGDSMEFEAKFQYRLPMYKVLQYVWDLPSYQPSVELLTSEAVQYDGKEQEIPPLLRFINMIINDATIQLDEGLENLVRIGELQREKRSEEWQSYNDEQKKEHQQKMAEATQMAKNRNQLASETVIMLELVTRHIQEPFVLPTMVDRITAMLNYVLKQLVGPKRRQLNVEDMDKYHFNPKQLVYKIVSIYVNLGQRVEFCQALPQDGRSFSLDLLKEATRIIRNLGHSELVGKMQSLFQKVQSYSEYLQMEETALDDAPEEFLDPVTNELMKEPVRLPTSGVTMDKSNVIRHLLSDSTDPFNRSPLTADMLEPNQLLKQRIEEWRKQKLAHLRKEQTD